MSPTPSFVVNTPRIQFILRIDNKKDMEDWIERLKKCSEWGTF